MSIGIGKVVGEVIAAPVTVASEVVEAAEAIPDQIEKAVDRALDPPPKKPRS